VRGHVLLPVAGPHLHPASPPLSQYRAAVSQPGRRGRGGAHCDHRARDDWLPTRRSPISHRCDRRGDLVRACHSLFRGLWTKDARLVAGGGVRGEAPRGRGPGVADAETGFPRAGRFLSRYPGISCRGTMSESVRIISPIAGTVYAERPIASDAEIGAALSAARAALPEWRK